MKNLLMNEKKGEKYRCIVSRKKVPLAHRIYNSASTVLTIAIMFFFTNFVVAQNYCTINYENTEVVNIDEVRFGSISAPEHWNQTIPFAAFVNYPNGYLNYTSNPSFWTFVKPGLSYPIRVIAEATEDLNYRVVVYVDWDADGTFEYQLDLGTQTTNKVYNGSIVVPANAALGSTRMRIIGEIGHELLPAPEPCGRKEMGDAIDYRLIVKDNETMTLDGIEQQVNNNNIYLANSKDEMLVGFNIKTSRGNTNLSLDKVNINFSGSTNIGADVSSVRLEYSRAHNSAFSYVKLAGNSIGVSGNTVTLNNNNISYLNTGDNWFWVVIELSSAASASNIIQARITGLELVENGSTLVIPVSGLVSTRTISPLGYCYKPILNTGGRLLGYIDSISYSGLNFSHFEPKNLGVNGKNNYFNNRTPAIDVCAGTSSELKLKFHTFYGLPNQGHYFILALFDWNQDGDFEDANELYFVGNNKNSLVGEWVSVQRTIIPPPDALPGHTMMRITASQSLSFVSCAGHEVQDFGILVHSVGDLSIADDLSYLGSPTALSLEATNTMGDYTYEYSTDKENWSIMGIGNESSMLTQAIDTTTYFRLSAVNAQCPGNTNYSSVVTAPFVGVNKVIPIDPVICEGESIELEALHEYKTHRFENTDLSVAQPNVDYVVESSTIVDGIMEQHLNQVLLDSVCFTVLSDARYAAYLIAPNGMSSVSVNLADNIEVPSLVTWEPKSGRYCFVTSGGDEFVPDEKIAPGTYQPLQNFERLNGINPNGEWKLLLNMHNGTLFSVTNFTLHFGVNDGVTWLPNADIDEISENKATVSPSVRRYYKALLSNRVSVFSDSTQVLVESGADANLQITQVNPDAICEGEQVNVIASVDNAVLEPYLTWYVNDVQIPNSNTLQFSSSGLADQDLVKVSLELNTLCRDYNEMDEVTVDVFPLPNAEFTYVAEQLHLQFSPGQSTHTSYLWYFGDGQSSTLNEPMHQYAASGSYDVCLTTTDNNGCDNQFCETIQALATNISEFSEKIKVFVKPNPVSSQLYVKGVEDGVRYSISNNMGQHVLEGEVFNDVAIDVNSLISGNYVLRLYNKEGQGHVRFVKH